MNKFREGDEDYCYIRYLGSPRKAVILKEGRFWSTVAFPWGFDSSTKRVRNSKTLTKEQFEFLKER